jgi:hypothetical protein
VHKSGSVKVFGCRPHDDGATCTGAGVRKPPREETAMRDVVGYRALWGFDCRERGVSVGAGRLSVVVDGFAVHERPASVVSGCIELWRPAHESRSKLGI